MTSSPASKYANFERIPAEEQQRILEACIDEFARNGYEAASTNTIVRQAGIPKGTLFYYFGSKKDLYLYVLDRAVSRFSASFSQISGALPDDLFERLTQRGKARMQFVAREPRLYQLFYNAFINAPEEIQSELQARYAGYYQTSAQHLIDGLDRSKFKDGVQIEKAVELVNLVLEGLYNRYLPAFKSLSPQESLVLVEKISAETDKYFDLLKMGIYKSPNQIMS